MPARQRAALVLVAVGVLGLACAEYIAAPGERVPRGLLLDSLQYTVDEGQTLNLVATVLDQIGAPFDTLPKGVAITWSSADTTVARVDTAGVLSGIAAGATQVNAAASGAFGTFKVSAPVTVRPLVTSLTAVAGDSQSGTVGQLLPVRLTVRVLNRLGAGVPRITISFAAVDSGGTLDTASTTTDSTGVASAGWTLGTRAGTDSVRVTTPRLPGAAVVFTAQARPGAAVALLRSSGDSQTAAAKTTLPAPLVAKAADRYGNGVPGVMVHWVVASGGGSITPDSAPTGAQGTASAQWTLGATVGTQTATATAGGGALAATFTATATGVLAPPATVTVTPNPDTLASGSTLQLTATPKDSAGNPLAGRTVTWTTSDTTIAKVSATGLVTAVKVGTATITATVQGVAGTATVVVKPGPASVTQSFVSVSASTVAVGGAVTLKLTTRDAAGDSLTTGGYTVAFTQSGGTSAGTIGAVTDNANGTYTATFTATTAGTPVAIGATIAGLAVVQASPPTIQVNAVPSTLVHWANPVNGQWAAAGNWNPARVPTLQDTAVVDAAGTYLVSSAGDSVGGLVIGTSTASAASVRFGGASRVRGDVEVRAGADLDAAATVFVGAIRNDGETDVEKGAVLAVDTTGPATAANYGALYLNDSSFVNVSRAPAGFVNHGQINLLSQPTLESGSPFARATLVGNVTLGSGSVIVTNLSGTALGSYGVLGVTGKATLGDTLRVQLYGAFVPSAGQVFIPVTWTSFSGTFASVRLPALVGGQWQVAYTSVGLTLTVVAGPAASVSAWQGDGQTATAGTAVLTPPAVRVTDAGGNGVVGKSVTFAVASGGGSVIAPATVLTDSNGVATVGGWQLGPVAGTNTLTATVAATGLTGNPVTFTATGTTPTLTWTGAVSTDWSNANNWSPALVPSANGDVFIGPATNEPVLTGPSAARTVTIQGSGAQLRINGQTLTAATLNVASAGLLFMTNGADVVDVSGNVSFDGGNENGGLTAGQLRFGGNFNENISTSNASFAPSGTHRTVLTGSTLQTVTFVDLTGASSFQDLDLSPSAGINIQFDYNGLVVKGALISKPTGAVTPMLYGLGRGLTARQLQVSRLVVDDAALIVNEGATALAQQLDSVTFQNFRYVIGTTIRDQLTLTLQGASPARLLTFNGLTFTLLSTGSSGLYLVLTSNGGATTLTVNGSNVTNGPAFTQTSANATVIWQ